MNINFLKFKIKKTFKKKNYGFNLSVAWGAIVLLAVFSLAGILYYEIGIFSEINRDFDANSTSVKNEAEKVRKLRLDKELKYFSEREQKSENIINLRSPFIDPSN